MDTPVIVAIISASAAVVASAGTFYLTKEKERKAEWRRYKFELYKELVQSLSGIVGTDSTPEGNQRFAVACNTLHLIASQRVITALHEFQDEIRVSNINRDSNRHDALRSRLQWEIRKDLRIQGTHASTNSRRFYFVPGVHCLRNPGGLSNRPAKIRWDLPPSPAVRAPMPRRARLPA
jgi:hypothetical protein